VDCGVDLGVVYAQTKRCDPCRIKRNTLSRKKSHDKRDRRMNAPPRLAELNQPSPCDTNDASKHQFCVNYKLCSTQKLACQSFWQYVQGKKWVGEPRIPNKGYYEASYSEDWWKTSRMEYDRLMSLLPEVFTLKELLAMDSFLPENSRRAWITTAIAEGRLERISGGRLEDGKWQDRAWVSPTTFQKLSPNGETPKS
jgi:hypothetical protein